MKTSELIGPALDWAVAKIVASEKHRKLQIVGNWAGGFKTLILPATVYHNPRWANYSTDWSQAGTIIERERIKVFPNVGGTWSAQIRHTESHPLVSHPVLDGWTNSSGPTALIAAMRCLVASRLGDEVEIPNELQGVT